MPVQFLMSDAKIQQAILYVNGLSSRQVLCNCPSCLLNAEGLVERSLNRKSWINPATAKSHAARHANHSFTDDPLVYNPNPSKPFKHLTYHQVQEGLQTAKLQALSSSQHGGPSAAEGPSPRQSDTSYDEAGPSSSADGRTAEYFQPECLPGGRYMVGFWSCPQRKRPTIEQLEQQQPGQDGCCEVIGKQHAQPDSGKPFVT